MKNLNRIINVLICVWVHKDKVGPVINNKAQAPLGDITGCQCCRISFHNVHRAQTAHVQRGATSIHGIETDIHPGNQSGDGWRERYRIIVGKSKG